MEGTGNDGALSQVLDPATHATERHEESVLFLLGEHHRLSPSCVGDSRNPGVAVSSLVDLVLYFQGHLHRSTRREVLQDRPVSGSAQVRIHAGVDAPP